MNFLSKESTFGKQKLSDHISLKTKKVSFSALSLAASPPIKPPSDKFCPSKFPEPPQRNNLILMTDKNNEGEDLKKFNDIALKVMINCMFKSAFKKIVGKGVNLPMTLASELFYHADKHLKTEQLYQGLPKPLSITSKIIQDNIITCLLYTFIKKSILKNPTANKKFYQLVRDGSVESGFSSIANIKCNSDLETPSQLMVHTAALKLAFSLSSQLKEDYMKKNFESIKSLNLSYVIIKANNIVRNFLDNFFEEVKSPR